MERITEKLHGDDSSFSSDDEKKKSRPATASPAAGLKEKVFRLFGRERHVHHVLKPQRVGAATVLAEAISPATTGLTTIANCRADRTSHYAAVESWACRSVADCLIGKSAAMPWFACHFFSIGPLLLLPPFLQRDPVTCEEHDRVEFYRNMRWNQMKGWIAPEVEENYEKMVEIRSQALEGGEELTDGDIVEKVLGKRSGYVIGLGCVEVPPSRKARLMYSMDEVNQLRARTEEQELIELRAWKASQEAWKASQEELSNAQQQMIDAQAKKQEETELVLNALKQKFGL